MKQLVSPINLHKLTETIIRLCVYMFSLSFVKNSLCTNSCKKFVLLYIILKERVECLDLMFSLFCDTSVVEMEHVSKYCSECSILSNTFWISGDWKKQVTSSRPCYFCSSGVHLFCRNVCRLHWGNIIVLIYKIQSLKLALTSAMKGRKVQSH